MCALGPMYDVGAQVVRVLWYGRHSVTLTLDIARQSDSSGSPQDSEGRRSWGGGGEEWREIGECRNRGHFWRRARRSS